MATQIYGQSDDLIEFDGDVSGEATGTDDDPGTLIVCSDGTLLTVKYGKPGMGGVWAVTVLKAGALFDRLEPCVDEDAPMYSDVAHFRDGLAFAYTASDWKKVR